jgi:hypothetical protein
MQTYTIEHQMTLAPYGAQWFICQSFDYKREAAKELRKMRATYPADKFRLRRCAIQSIPCRAKRRQLEDF